MKVSQNKLTLAFVDPSIEQAFLKSYFEKTKRQSQHAILLAILLYALFSINDGWIAPEQKEQLWLIRLGGVVPLFGLIYSLTFTQWFETYYQILLAAVVIIADIGIFSILLITSKSGIYLYESALMLVIIWSFVLSGMRFFGATVISLVCLMAFEVVAIFVNRAPFYFVLNHNFLILSALWVAGFAGYMIESYARKGFYKKKIIDEERQQNEALLLNILPSKVVNELKETSKVTAQRFDVVTILFADIVGFTTFAASKPPIEVVNALNRIFTCFDTLVEKYQLEKIKTIGDAYMVVAGAPDVRNDHCQAIAVLALDMLNALSEIQEKTDASLNIRIGIQTGAVVGGVIGTKKFHYDIWGDAVNMASRMESNGVPGKIHTTQEVYETLKDQFAFEDRGILDIKGKGPMHTYFLGNPLQLN